MTDDEHKDELLVLMGRIDRAIERSPEISVGNVVQTMIVLAISLIEENHDITTHSAAIKFQEYVNGMINSLAASN